jgi:hypothetical protein
VEAREAKSESEEVNENDGEMRWRAELMEDDKSSFEKTKSKVLGNTVKRR